MPSTTSTILRTLGAAAEVYRVARKLATTDVPEKVLADLPSLTLEIVPADTCAVVHAPQGKHATLSSAGSSLVLGASWVAEALDEALTRGRPAATPQDDDGPWALAVPLRIGHTHAALVVAQDTTGQPLDTSSLAPLGVVAVVAAQAHARATATAALDAWRGYAVAAANGAAEGFVFLDNAGVVQDIDTTTATAFRLDQRACVGRTAADLPGLHAIADALARRENPSEAVELATGGRHLSARELSTPGGPLWVLTIQQPQTRTDAAFQSRYTFNDIVTADPVMQTLLRDAHRAAIQDIPILVTGESGTGKELLAQAIHAASPRSTAPFVAVNVAAIPGELLESELFGYAPGAFTGARARGKPGSFELAGRGTLLLDEIGEMQPVMQAKLLRVLQENQLVRVGGTRPLRVDARIVTTTNRDLQQEVSSGRFRLDLYHRLRVVHLDLPPLRQRISDIPLLCDHFLEQACKRLDRPRVRLTERVQAQLERHEWPGNLRELSNLLLGTVSLLPRDVRTVAELPIFPRSPQLTPIVAPTRQSAPPAPRRNVDPVRPLEQVESDAVRHAMKSFDGNMSQVAKALGISRTTLYKKIEKYGLG